MLVEIIIIIVIMIIISSSNSRRRMRWTGRWGGERIREIKSWLRKRGEGNETNMIAEEVDEGDK